MEKQLLDVFLDLYTYNNDIKSWSFESFKTNPPRYHRLQILQALMRALSISCSYIEFSQGNFITSVQVEKWTAFKESIANQLPQDKIYRPARKPLTPNKLGILFSTLMRYRLNANKLVSSNNGILTISDDFRIYFDIMNTMNEKLSDELVKVDLILLFCINPTGISYTKDELISKFGYPEVDLKGIDIEWM
jgi:hypothetical protein